jgi:hypothetical protein
MLSQRRVFRRVIILTGVGTALSFIAQIILSEHFTFWWRLCISAFGTICASTAVIVPLIQQRMNEQTLQDAEHATQTGRLAAYTELQDSLAPAASVLASIACEETEAGRMQLKSSLKQAMVHLAVEELGPKRTRSCFYDYVKGPPPSLKCNGNWAGRATAPQDYTTKNLIGRIALTMVGRREYSFRPDLDADPPPGWPTDRDYKTYIAVTVETGPWIFGMLTLDSLKAGDLAEGDVRQMRLLASLLASGLAINANTAPRLALRR